MCVDWNGVLDTYTGYQNGKIYPPREGARNFLKRLTEAGFRVVILSSVDKAIVMSWLAKHELLVYVDEVTNKKVAAIVYLDDRGITFTGDFGLAFEQIIKFKAHWETDDIVETPRR